MLLFLVLLFLVLLLPVSIGVSISGRINESFSNFVTISIVMRFFISSGIKSNIGNDLLE